MIPTLTLAGLIAAVPNPDPTRLALVIANNQSLDEGVQPLKFADDDAARLFELLGGFGFNGRLLTVLDNDTAAQYPEVSASARPPSWERLERAVKEFRRIVLEEHDRGREVELLISFSGHGAVGSRGVPYLNLLDRRLYRGDFFRDVVAAVGADFVHVIIDACRARDFVDARGGPDGPDFGRELSLFLAQERRVKHPEVGVVVAESADGETHEWARTRSGVFAHEVFSGLSGGADVNGDGLVEYSELHSFVAAANAAIEDPRARLRVVAQPPPVNPRKPLLSIRTPKGLERVQTPASGGWFTIEDNRGVRWVDAHLAEGTQVTLHLPARPRYYVVDVYDSKEAVVEPRPDGAVVVLASLAFESLSLTVSRGSIAEALKSGLFRTPHGANYYRGFVGAMRYPSVLKGMVVASADQQKPGFEAAAVEGSVDNNDASTKPEEPEIYEPFVPSGWQVGLSLALGVGWRQDMDKLEANLRRLFVAAGTTAHPDFANRPVGGSSFSLDFHGNYRLFEYLNVGLQLGVLLREHEVNEDLLRELLDEYGVEPVNRDQGETLEWFRIGPTVEGRFPFGNGFSGLGSVAGGYWIDMDSSSGSETRHGWWVRPMVGGAYNVIDALEINLGLGYAYLAMFDEHPTALQGFEFQLGAELLL